VARAKGLPYHPCSGKTPEISDFNPGLGKQIGWTKKIGGNESVWNAYSLSQPRFEA